MRQLLSVRLAQRPFSWGRKVKTKGVRIFKASTSDHPIPHAEGGVAPFAIAPSTSTGKRSGTSKDTKKLVEGTAHDVALPSTTATGDEDATSLAPTQQDGRRASCKIGARTGDITITEAAPGMMKIIKPTAKRPPTSAASNAQIREVSRMSPTQVRNVLLAAASNECVDARLWNAALSRLSSMDNILYFDAIGILKAYTVFLQLLQEHDQAREGSSGAVSSTTRSCTSAAGAVGASSSTTTSGRDFLDTAADDHQQDLQCLPKIQPAEHDLFQKLFDDICSQASRLAVPHILQTLEVCERLELRPRVLYVELFHHLIRLMPAMYAEELVQAVQVLARLNLQNDQLQSEIMTYVLHHEREFRFLHLCSLQCCLTILNRTTTTSASRMSWGQNVARTSTPPASTQQSEDDRSAQPARSGTSSSRAGAEKMFLQSSKVPEILEKRALYEASCLTLEEIYECLCKFPEMAFSSKKFEELLWTEFEARLGTEVRDTEDVDCFAHPMAVLRMLYAQGRGGLLYTAADRTSSYTMNPNDKNDEKTTTCSHVLRAFSQWAHDASYRPDTLSNKNRRPTSRDLIFLQRIAQEAEAQLVVTARTTCVSLHLHAEEDHDHQQARHQVGTPTRTPQAAEQMKINSTQQSTPDPLTAKPMQTMGRTPNPAKKFVNKCKSFVWHNCSTVVAQEPDDPQQVSNDVGERLTDTIRASFSSAAANLGLAGGGLTRNTPTPASTIRTTSNHSTRSATQLCALAIRNFLASKGGRQQTHLKKRPIDYRKGRNYWKQDDPLVDSATGERVKKLKKLVEAAPAKVQLDPAGGALYPGVEVVRGPRVPSPEQTLAASSVRSIDRNGQSRPELSHFVASSDWNHLARNDQEKYSKNYTTGCGRRHLRQERWSTSRKLLSSVAAGKNTNACEMKITNRDNSRNMSFDDGNPIPVLSRDGDLNEEQHAAAVQGNRDENKKSSTTFPPSSGGSLLHQGMSQSESLEQLLDRVAASTASNSAAATVVTPLTRTTTATGSSPAAAHKNQNEIPTRQELRLDDLLASSSTSQETRDRVAGRERDLDVAVERQEKKSHLHTTGENRYRRTGDYYDSKGDVVDEQDEQDQQTSYFDDLDAQLSAFLNNDPDGVHDLSRENGSTRSLRTTTPFRLTSAVRERTPYLSTQMLDYIRKTDSHPAIRYRSGQYILRRGPEPRRDERNPLHYLTRATGQDHTASEDALMWDFAQQKFTYQVVEDTDRQRRRKKYKKRPYPAYLMGGEVDPKLHPHLLVRPFCNGAMTTYYTKLKGPKKNNIQAK